MCSAVCHLVSFTHMLRYMQRQVNQWVDDLSCVVCQKSFGSIFCFRCLPIMLTNVSRRNVFYFEFIAMNECILRIYPLKSTFSSLVEALLGSSAYVSLKYFGATPMLRVVVGFSSAVMCRFFAWKYGIR